jgi:hypothetical protein
MKVKCVLCGVLGLTPGKEYQVIKETDDAYTVIDNDGHATNYYKWVFELKF